MELWSYGACDKGDWTFELGKWLLLWYTMMIHNSEIVNFCVKYGSAL